MSKKRSSSIIREKTIFYCNACIEVRDTHPHKQPDLIESRSSAKQLKVADDDDLGCLRARR
jgi:hypothetical protein